MPYAGAGSTFASQANQLTLEPDGIGGDHELATAFSLLAYGAQASEGFSQELGTGQMAVFFQLDTGTMDEVVNHASTQPPVIGTELNDLAARFSINK